MKRAILRFILPLVLGLTLGMLLLMIFENSLIYFPAKYPEGEWNPGVAGLHPDDVSFSTSDGLQLHGWFFGVESARATILWCHGNAGNITHRLHNITKLLPLGVNVFIFDYRGYGKSEGTPSEEGLYLDAEAAYAYLTEHLEINASSVIIFGRSLGASVAVDLASKKPCRGVILESAFTSAGDMARGMIPFLPIQFLIRSRYEADKHIDDIHVPILFTHGSEDRTIPLKLGKKLFERANEPKFFWEIPGADHNDTYIVGGEAYFQRLNEFIDFALSKTL